MTTRPLPPVVVTSPPLDPLLPVPPDDSPEVAVGGGPLVAVVGLPVTVVAVVDGLPGVLMPPEPSDEPAPVVVEAVSVPEDASPSPSPESHAGTRRTKEAKEIQRRCMRELEATPSGVHTQPHTVALVDSLFSRHSFAVAMNGGRAARMLGLVAVMLGAWSGPAVANSDPESGQADKPSLEAFEGQYIYAGGASQIQEIHDEIEAATEDLNVALRLLARREIWKSQEPSRMMSISVDGDTVSIVRSGGKAAFTGKIGGGSFPVDKYRGRFKRRGDKLIVDITGGAQHTLVRFSVNPKSHTVTVRTTIEHNMLPRPVRLKKTFRAVG